MPKLKRTKTLSSRRTDEAVDFPKLEDINPREASFLARIAQHPKLLTQNSTSGALAVGSFAKQIAQVFRREKMTATKSRASTRRNGPKYREIGRTREQSSPAESAAKDLKQWVASNSERPKSI